MKKLKFITALFSLLMVITVFGQDLSYNTDNNINPEYPKSSLQNLEEGVVNVKFQLNEFNQLDKMQIIGNVSTELKEAAKNSIQKYINTNQESLDSNVVYEIPVRFEIE